MARDITVEATQRQITIMNKKGEEILIGEVLAEDYQGEVKRFQFSPDAKNPWANESKKKAAYQLGSGSKHLSFINPADAQRILIDQGWSIKEQYATLGGLSMQTVYINKDAQFTDPIEYDKALWPGRDGMDKMWPCVILNTNLTIGRIAAEYTAAVYRQICTNGMGGSVLSMPSLRFRHTDWDADTIAIEVAEEMALTYQGLPRGPEVANVENMRSTLVLLTNYVNEMNSDEGLSPRFKYIEEHFGALSPNVVRPWAMANYITHLRALLASKGAISEPIYALDLLNAYTSGVNQYRLENHSDRGTMQALGACEGVVRTTSAFATFAGLFGAN